MIVKCAVIYTCAVLLLLTAETSGSEKICNLRECRHPQELWNYFAGYSCYSYTNTYRLNFFFNITHDSRGVPVAHRDNATFTFDYTDNTATSEIRKAFKTDYFFQMWESCCQEAADCCSNVMNEKNIDPSEEYPCPAIWDGWTCFLPAQRGTIEKRTCSNQAYSTDSDVCELESEKECFPNGTWNQKTNYEVCAMAPILRNRHNFNVIVVSISAVLSFPAVIILFSFRSFRQNLRFIMHRNLISVIIISYLFTIMAKEIVILDDLSTVSNNVMEDSPASCKVLAFFENVAKNGMFACMLAEGFYLHKLIVRPFANDPSIVFVYAAVGTLSFLPSIAWAIARAIHNAGKCWMADETNDQWIVDGFRIGTLGTNFLLLVDIIRVMIMKLKRGGISQQTRSTLRATLFLIPLFGIHILLITDRDIVGSNTCKAQDIYNYISYLLEGLQGVMVSTLFCYINAEVRGEIKNAFRKLVLELEARFDITLSKRKDYRRRTTAATYVDTSVKAPFETKA